MATKDYSVILCDAPECIREGSRQLRDKLESTLKARGIEKNVHISLSGCLGMCSKGPIVIVNPGFTVYGNVSDSDIDEIVDLFFGERISLGLSNQMGAAKDGTGEEGHHNGYGSKYGGQCHNHGGHTQSDGVRMILSVAFREDLAEQ